MQFQSITGQSHTKTHLIQMVQQNRLSHALLFLGKEGSGALQLAFAFAQYITCQKVNGKQTELAAAPSLFGEVPQTQSLSSLSPQDVKEFDSCGLCAACKKANEFVHPDIHFCYPVIPSKPGDKPISTDYIKQWREFIQQQPYGNVYDWLQHINAENKQGNITSEECNDIIRKMSLKSFEAEYKILIVWMPEYLSKNGNKLLKLIEEPPPNTLFIFVAENDALILPTILSRTQLVKIPLHTNAEIEEALQLQKEITISQARQIAAVADGNIREALHLLQNADEDWQPVLREWLNATLKTGPVAQVKWIEDISKIGREKQKQFLKYFTHLLEQAIRISTLNPSSGVAAAHADNEFALRLNKICNIAQKEAIVNELDKASYYIERNANPKMLFHALTIKLYHIISNKSVILMQ
jgi:DNA polymerase III subunit delta'